MNGKDLISFSQYQILTWIAYLDRRRQLENWVILELFFIHCKTVKVCENGQIWFRSVFLLYGTELRTFSHFRIFDFNRILDLSRYLGNWLIFKFIFIHCKTVKVSQDNQIRMYKWFTTVFFMNGKELRSFSHYQISS